MKPGGILAIWSYERCPVDPACDEIIEKIFAEVDAYWPPEREIVEGKYCDITLPMPEVAVEAFEMHLEWTVNEMLSYLRTWSATQRYIQANNADPVALYAQELGEQWGDRRRDVRWPLTLKVGRKAA